MIGVIDRKNKLVYARIAHPNANGSRLTAKQLLDVLRTVSKQENRNIVITDEFKSYGGLSHIDYVHLRIDHSKAFSDGNGTHTNNIESFWATLKRGIYGIYHHISVEYMQRYVDEFCFRYNNRENDMFTMILKQSVLI